MSYYKEFRKRPYYSLSAQKLANSFPGWSKARTDKHSNFQSIMSDMSEQFDMFSLSIFDKYNKQFHIEQDVSLPAKYYKYTDDGSVFFTTADGTFNLPPRRVVGTIGGEAYELTPCAYGDILDLGNRHFLDFKESTVVLPRVSVLESRNAHGTNEYLGEFDNVNSKSEFVLFVKEPVYLGFALEPKDETAVIVNENFFAKRKNPTGNNAYILGSAILLDYATSKSVATTNLLPKYEHSFTGVVHPGLYILKFDLLTEDQFNDFYIKLIVNNCFPSSRKKLFYTSNYTIENTNKVAYMSVEEDFLIVQSLDYFNETSDFILDRYILFDENDETVYPSSFLKKDVFMYALENPTDLTKSSKLHVYDLFMHGSHSVYEENHKYIMDLVCDRIDYKPGDSIYIETRPTEFLYGKKIKNLLLTVQNIESGSLEYIDETGYNYQEEDVWEPGPVRQFDSTNQEIRWKYNLGEQKIGTFIFSCYNNDTGEILGRKIINVDYKTPYKSFLLDSNYTGFELGISPDQEIQLVKDLNTIIELSFLKDGWLYDEGANTIYTNTEFDQLVTEY
jgi:hypothetical protein